MIDHIARARCTATTRRPLRQWPLLATLLVGACNNRTPAAPAPFDLNAARRQITELNDRFTKAHISGDIETIDAMFVPDATSYPPGAPAVRGIPALHDFTAEYIKAGISDFRETSTELYGTADYLVDAGTFVVTYGPDQVTEHGKYLNIWTQVDGRWKIKSNMWNTNDAPLVQ